MNKALLITATSILLIAGPAFAEHGSNTNNGKAGAHAQVKTTANINEETNESVTGTPTVTPSENPDEKCNPNDTWKNHGAYVSCVAKLHVGGKAVSEAAKSNVGKHGNDQDNDDNDHISPEPTSTVSATPTQSPLTSEAQSAQLSRFLDIKPLLEAIANLFHQLSQLI